jgi:hypothetical protein
MFSACGRVVRATVCTDRETGYSRGFGFIERAEGSEELCTRTPGCTKTGNPAQKPNLSRP